MSNDLQLEAYREIIISNSGKKDIQSYYINLIQIKDSEGASIITNSSDPYMEYCNHIRELDKKYNWEKDAVYLWELDKSDEAYDIYLDCAIENKNSKDFIIFYNSRSDTLIQELDDEIKEAVLNDYKLEWQVW